MDFKTFHLPPKLFFFSNPFKNALSHLLLFLSLIIASIFCYNILSPLQPGSIFDIDFLSQFLPNSACDYSYGKWVWDERLPLRRYNETCRFLDPGFRCQRSGRKDLDYQKWRWQPEKCNLPRFDAKDFLERGRNRRIVFAGDSISRNQWESLVCMLTEGISNQSMVYEKYGNPITKHKGSLCILFQEYNLTVEYYRVPYLVVMDHRPPNAPKEVYGTIRVDRMHQFASQWIEADVLVFSTGHWWNRDKTVKMGHYFQEGDSVNMTMTVIDAFQKSLETLKAWLMQNFNTGKGHVIFRSYSPVHYRGGPWNQGGHCNVNKRPETDYTKLESEPLQNTFMYEIVKQMSSTRRNVQFLNITYLTEFRKDGHPSNHREQGTPANAPQDCSHWCLPGVPDTWNELLYAKLLTNGFRTRLN